MRPFSVCPKNATRSTIRACCANVSVWARLEWVSAYKLKTCLVIPNAVT